MAGYRPACDYSDSDDDMMVFGNEDFPVEEYFPTLRVQSDPTKQEPAVSSCSGRGGFGLPGNKSPNTSLFKRSHQQTRAVPRSVLSDGRTLPVDDFMGSVVRGDVEVMLNYLNQGLPVDTVLKSGWTALMYAVSYSNVRLAKELLARGANANFEKDGYTVIMEACASKNPGALECVQILLDHAASVNRSDKYGVTPLMYAAREGSVSVVSKLLECRADMNARDVRGSTSLIWATVKNRFEVVKILVEHGADLMHSDNRQKTAVDIATESRLGELAEYLVDKMPPEYQAKFKGVNANLNSSPGKATNGSNSVVDHQAVRSSGDEITNMSQQIVTDTKGARNNKHSYTRYGDLDLFLCGLELSRLSPIFQEHQIEFADFLRVGDQDLIQLGINQLGVRKKILEGIREVHKADWQSSSLTDITKHINCTDAVSMVANIEKHVSCICSSIIYLQQQIHARPRLLQSGQDGMGADKFKMYTSKCKQSAKNLYSCVSKLEAEMDGVSAADGRPVDVIQYETTSGRWRYAAYRCVALGALLGVCFWYRKDLASLIGKCSSRFRAV